MLAPLPVPKGSRWKPQSTVLVPQTPQGVRSSGKVGRRGEGGVSLSGISSLTSVRGDSVAVSFEGEEHLRVSGVPSMAHLTPGGPLCPLVGWPHLVHANILKVLDSSYSTLLETLGNSTTSKHLLNILFGDQY